MFAKTVILFSLAPRVLGTLYITTPTSSTTFTAGQQAMIKWQDDNAPPSLAQFGLAKVSIYTGNSTHQTQLQLITANVDVSKTSAIQFTPDPSIGPDSNNYFIRIESLNLRDTNQPQYPTLAFSSKFQMTGMSGSPNAGELAQGNSVTSQTSVLSGPSKASVPSSTTTTTRATTSNSSKTSGNVASGFKSSPFGLLLVVIIGAAML